MSPSSNPQPPPMNRKASKILLWNGPIRAEFFYIKMTGIFAEFVRSGILVPLSTYHNSVPFFHNFILLQSLFFCHISSSLFNLTIFTFLQTSCKSGKMVTISKQGKCGGEFFSLILTKRGGEIGDWKWGKDRMLVPTCLNQIEKNDLFFKGECETPWVKLDTGCYL